MTSEQPSENKYMIDIESGAETARLMEQDRLTTQAMGGIFPEQPDLSTTRRILDLGCGPGSWLIDVAFTHPQIELIGVDINQTMVDYARAQAFTRGYDNAHFQIMDIKEGLAFPDAFFDVVNARFIFSFMDHVSWPALMAECKRVLRPGGIIRLTEPEAEVSTSMSGDRLFAAFNHALAAQKRTYSVSGNTIGVVHMFKKLLQQAGFERVNQRSYLVDRSADSPLFTSSFRNGEIAFALLKPYLIASGVVDEAEYETLYQQMLIDMLGEDFMGLGFGVLTWAYKPEEA